MQQTQLLTTGDAAKVADVSVETIRRWDRSGKLAAVRTAGGLRLFERAAVLKVVEARRQHAGLARG
jgi:excisionase family DNA binding protein